VISALAAAAFGVGEGVGDGVAVLLEPPPHPVRAVRTSTGRTSRRFTRAPSG